MVALLLLQLQLLGNSQKFWQLGYYNTGYIIKSRNIVENANYITEKRKRNFRNPCHWINGRGITVVLIFTLTPWNLAPSQVTEDVTILAVTEYGCAGESQLGVSVVIEGCEFPL